MSADPDFQSALSAHFPEPPGFVTTLPSSEVDFLALVQRVQSELLLKATNFQGIFQRRLTFEGLCELRREAGMADFAWPTFLQLLAQALQSCRALLEPQGLRLQLRFQLQSAVLLANLQLEPMARMPQLPEALPFLQDGMRCASDHHITKASFS